MTGDGARVWLFPDGYLPAVGAAGLYTGHEAICLVNTGDQDAQVWLDLYFEDRDPVEGLPFHIGAKRSLHVRLDRPEVLGGYVLPRETPYSARIRADRRVVAQVSRLDVTQPNAALMTTLGYPVPEQP